MAHTLPPVDRAHVIGTRQTRHRLKALFALVRADRKPTGGWREILSGCAACLSDFTLPDLPEVSPRRRRLASRGRRRHTGGTGGKVRGLRTRSARPAPPPALPTDHTLFGVVACAQPNLCSLSAACQATCTRPLRHGSPRLLARAHPQPRAALNHLSPLPAPLRRSVRFSYHIRRRLWRHSR